MNNKVIKYHQFRTKIHLVSINDKNRMLKMGIWFIVIFWNVISQKLNERKKRLFLWIKTRPYHGTVITPVITNREDCPNWKDWCKVRRVTIWRYWKFLSQTYQFNATWDCSAEFSHYANMYHMLNLFIRGNYKITISSALKIIGYFRKWR